LEKRDCGMEEVEEEKLRGAAKAAAEKHRGVTEAAAEKHWGAAEVAEEKKRGATEAAEEQPRRSRGGSGAAPGQGRGDRGGRGAAPGCGRGRGRDTTGRGEAVRPPSHASGESLAPKEAELWRARARADALHLRPARYSPSCSAPPLPLHLRRRERRSGTGGASDVQGPRHKWGTRRARGRDVL